MINEKELEKTIVWLAGLLSTDGVVQAGQGEQQKYCFFVVYSTEQDWLQVIHDRLRDVGLKSKIHWNPEDLRHCRIQILDPFRVRELLIKYDCEKFFNPRKWKRIIGAYQAGVHRRFWTLEEEEWLKENYMRYSDNELAKKFNRSVGAILQKRYQLKLFKRRGKMWRESQMQKS